MKHKQITFEQRYAIEHMLKEKHSKKSIISTLGLVESTFYRELKAIVRSEFTMLNMPICWQKSAERLALCVCEKIKCACKCCCMFSHFIHIILVPHPRQFLILFLSRLHAVINFYCCKGL
jgi:hypothetical protein